MKSEIVDNRYIVECACTEPSHVLTFDIDPDYAYVDVCFAESWQESRWVRLKQAIRYIIGRKKYIMSDNSIILNEYNLKQLKAVVKAMEAFQKKVKEN